MHQLDSGDRRGGAFEELNSSESLCSRSAGKCRQNAPAWRRAAGQSLLFPRKLTTYTEQAWENQGIDLEMHI